DARIGRAHGEGRHCDPYFSRPEVFLGNIDGVEGVGPSVLGYSVCTHVFGLAPEPPLLNGCRSSRATGKSASQLRTPRTVGPCAPTSLIAWPTANGRRRTPGNRGGPRRPWTADGHRRR